jgi:predicted nucleic acid-binding protein
MVPPVVDAWAVLAWLDGEPGSERVDRWLRRASRSGSLPMSTVNAGEVYYSLVKAAGDAKAREFTKDLRGRALPIVLVPATNPRVWRAAELKARYPIAYAGAFAAALAVELGAPLLTGDPDFRALERDGTVEIDWIRP